MSIVQKGPLRAFSPLENLVRESNEFNKSNKRTTDKAFTRRGLAAFTCCKCLPMVILITGNYSDSR